MTALIRIVNAFYAALFVLAAFVSLGFLTAALDGLGRGPEAVWISCAWAALMTGLAIVCFFNMRRAGRAAGFVLLAANAAALLLALAGLGAGGSVIRWIAGVSLPPFALTLAALALSRGRHQA